ncbi:MAG: YegS/Rv2252/BmrU family lipid kinase, partial [Chloroflexi bacterium]|nr:YegS/Rv2252/BmrU family lipid kinase [Chloroflexota bacterium]
MADTLVILNPSAGGGRAGVVWSQIEPVLWETLGDLVVAVTHHPEDVARHLKEARDVGLTRVVAIGGDGTNHAIVNAIQRLADADPVGPRITYGQLPIGTGQDFARMLGIPRDPVAAVEWLARAQPRAVDLGCLERGEVGKRYFLNIASVGIGGEVDRRVNAIHRRRPWTFKLATLKSFLTYQPRHMKVYTDGDEWYNDRAWAVVIANGQNFGHGMAIAPDARIDDGLFDVILIEDASRMNV